MNRGSSTIRNAVSGRRVASMRPRFMNRGSAETSDRRRAPWNSFNEAPIHESGKFSHCRSPRRRLSCFNEAPIHESGKSPASCPAWTLRPCFNEAPIHESGKSGCDPRWLPRPNASMRPRFMNRGSASGHPSRRKTAGCFNEAPIHESGKCGNRHAQRQLREAGLQ